MLDVGVPYSGRENLALAGESLLIFLEVDAFIRCAADRIIGLQTEACLPRRRVIFAGQRAAVAEHPTECPKPNDCFPISVFLVPALCYAFLGQEGSQPLEVSRRERSEALASLRIHGSGVLKNHVLDHH